MRVVENKGVTLFPVVRNNQPELSSLSARHLRNLLNFSRFLFLCSKCSPLLLPPPSFLGLIVTICEELP